MKPETTIPKDVQALIDCLDLMYNTVTQDIRTKFAPAMQSIRNELVNDNRLALSKKLGDRTQVLNQIANKSAPFLSGATDYVKGFREVKAMARKACK